MCESIYFHDSPRGYGKRMLEYYRPTGLSDGPVFDPVERKYDLDQITDEIWKILKSAPGIQGKLDDYEIDFDFIEKLPEEEGKQALRASVKNELRACGKPYELASLTKTEFSHLMGNLSLIYNESDSQIEEQVILIDQIAMRVINEYIQIDGLERLFSEHYIDFEWESHLVMDHTKQKMKFQRDHYIHQIRDAYMMDRLLTDGGFYGRVHKILTDPSASKVSQFFCKMCERQRRQCTNAALWKYVRFDKHFVERNIIYMSSYMAGLFHDIGYPETYLRSLQYRIRDFMPTMHREEPSLLPSGIFSLLQNSLLFRVIPFNEIQERLRKTSIDHGTLSAIAFLLHFYENGVIFQLEPYKAAAVEIAALAIYNHTFLYRISDPGAKAAIDYRPRFFINPISFLLRLCDDLQEWDRVYFEISSRSNILACPKCHTPIIGVKRGEERNSRRYVCNCCGSNDGNQPFTRIFSNESDFQYRRVHNVQVCDLVSVHALPQRTKITSLSEARDIVFRVDYDLRRLLHIAFISPTYAQYRSEELNKLKPLLTRQHGLPRIWLHYFVTANPILIKAAMLNEYFSGDTQTMGWDLSGFWNCSDFHADPVGRFDEKAASYLSTLRTAIENCYDSKEDEPLRSYVERAVLLYISLALYMKSHQVELADSVRTDIACHIAKQYAGDEVSSEFRCLLGDALLQSSRVYTEERLASLRSMPEAYFEQFEPGNWEAALTGKDAPRCAVDFYKTAVARYNDPQQYRPFFQRLRESMFSGSGQLEIDAFTDLCFFQNLSAKAGAVK